MAIKKDTDTSKQEGWLEGSVTLHLGGRDLKLDLLVPVEPVTARRMLPVFQGVTDSFVRFNVEDAETEGKAVSCKAGCGACCRQPVPIAIAEAYDIAEIVENLPEPQRSEVQKRFDQASTELKESGWIDRLYDMAPDAHEERQNWAMEYFEKQIACPFLEDESCSIHEQRPLACREYLVVSPAENCSAPTSENISMVKQPIRPSVVFNQISDSDENKTGRNYLPMIFAMRYAEENPESKNIKTSEEWLRHFFRNLAPPSPEPGS